MDAEAFDERYRSEADPWGYRSSTYEQAKYRATLEACGAGPFRRALELGASIGVFSRLLAPRCDALVTVDFSEVAVTRARRELADIPRVEVTLGEIPDDLPPGHVDLVVASEILYYLSSAALEATLAALEKRLDPGGRIVLVHWRPGGPERPSTAAEVHRRVRELPWLIHLLSAPGEAYLLDVLERPQAPSSGDVRGSSAGAP